MDLKLRYKRIIDKLLKIVCFSVISLTSQIILAQQIDIVDNNVNRNIIDDLHGYCDGINFTYEVYWESPTVTNVKLVDDATNTVLGSGNSSPLTITQATIAADLPTRTSFFL